MNISRDKFTFIFNLCNYQDLLPLFDKTVGIIKLEARGKCLFSITQIIITIIKRILNNARFLQSGRNANQIISFTLSPL